MSKPVILLVEDSQLVRETVTENLTDEGYAVVSAGNAEAMKERLTSVKPDTILLDLVLPDGDGLSLIRSIREHTDAPIIVISGKADMVDKVVGLEMGADDYIDADFDMVNLVICDWNMPRMNGVDFLRQIRTIFPDLPFLMVTGRCDKDSVVQAKMAGVTAFIKKPFSPDQLETKLRVLSQDI